MTKAQIVAEIVLLLQGTPIDAFVRENFAVEAGRPVVRCALRGPLDTPEGETCKRATATAMLRYSYRFNTEQLAVMADLFVHALDHLEPGASLRVRTRFCDRHSIEAIRDAAAAEAVCDRLSTDY